MVDLLLYQSIDDASVAERGAVDAPRSVRYPLVSRLKECFNGEVPSVGIAPTTHGVSIRPLFPIELRGYIFKPRVFYFKPRVFYFKPRVFYTLGFIIPYAERDVSNLGCVGGERRCSMTTERDPMRTLRTHLERITDDRNVDGDARIRAALLIAIVDDADREKVRWMANDVGLGTFAHNNP